MSLGDLVMYQSDSTSSGRGGSLYNVAAGTPILAGEPVMLAYRTVGAVTVEPLAQAAAATADMPTAAASTAQGTFVGVACTNSTNTTTAAGSVNVIPVDSGDTWLINPKYPLLWDTQAEYDAIVGKRVLIENGAQRLTYGSNVNAGTYSLLSTDSAANGAVVKALDISRNPGKVAISFRNSTSNLF